MGGASTYAAKLDPSNTRARVRGARGHLLSGDPDAAVVLFEQAVALDPSLQVRREQTDRQSDANEGAEEQRHRCVLASAFDGPCVAPGSWLRTPAGGI